jgi:D-3-phosphoglycerate dehydrogenase
MTVTVFWADPHPRLLPFEVVSDALAANGGELVIGNCESEDDLIAQAGACGAEVILISWRKIGGAAVMDALPKVRLMIRLGIGYDQIDDVAATERGIAAGNCPTYCSTEVAEHTIGLLYGAARQIVWLHERIREGQWVPASTDVHRIMGQTIGLVGFGSIGKKVAWRAQGLGLKVIAYDKYVDDAVMIEAGVEPVSLDELLERSDFVSCHTLLNAGTRGLIGAKELAKMKPTAYIINTSRGPVIDQAALTEVLKAGKIAGAAIDVFENEPLEDESELRGLQNVILTPHQAATSMEALADLKTELAANLIDWIHTDWSNAIRNVEVKGHLRPRI